MSFLATRLQSGGQERKAERLKHMKTLIKEPSICLSVKPYKWEETFWIYQTSGTVNLLWKKSLPLFIDSNSLVLSLDTP